MEESLKTKVVEELQLQISKTAYMRSTDPLASSILSLGP